MKQPYQWKLEGWYQEQTLVSTSSTSTIVMNQPRSLEARWQIDNAIPFAIAGSLVVLSVSAVYVVVHRRKSRRSGIVIRL